MYSPDDRYCPVAKRDIDSEICYEMVMCICGCFKASSVPEVEFTVNEETKKICDNCPYSDLD